MKRIAAAISALALAASMTAAPSAYANCSLPYIDDANPVGGKVELVVCCCGKAKSFDLKVVDMRTGKRVKAVKIRKRVWTVRVREHRTYRFSVRERGGRWNTMRYGIG